MHNESYGYLVFGVEDKNHEIVGTTFKAKSKKVKGGEDLEHWLSTRLSPRIDYRIFEHDIEEKHIVLFMIPAAIDRPIMFLNTSYIRVGSYTKKLLDYPEKSAKIPVSDWLQQTAQWAGIKSIISLERTREDKQTGKQEIDRQVYISSLPVDAQKIASVIRNHWGVENKVHWILDVVYCEDDCRIRKGDGAENVAVIRRFCLNLAKLHPSKSGMNSKRRQAGWNDDFRAEILFGQNVS